MVSKSQIDRLDERLKAGAYTDDDLQELDAYCQTFVDVYTLVVDRIRGELGLVPTGRGAKSRKSIEQKLQRGTTKLSQIQDIFGCRVVVDSLDNQDATTRSLLSMFGSAKLFDRRSLPSHGYRAVHLVVRVDSKWVEIQIRTRWQHVWAELSERLSDTLGIALKYGGGPAAARALLDHASQVVADLELVEQRINSLSLQRSTLRISTSTPPVDNELQNLQARYDILRPTVINNFGYLQNLSPHQLDR